MSFTSIEICAGAGGQALGLETAGFEHLAVVEIDKHATQTLRHNRPMWNVIEADLHDWDPSPYRSDNISLLAGGVPCPPFSMAGKQLGPADERDLFPRALEITKELRPKAIMLENVRGFLDARFADYRAHIETQLKDMGYHNPQWNLLNSSDYGVPQLRPRVVLVAFLDDDSTFIWPKPTTIKPQTVGETLQDLMSENGWAGANQWALEAKTIAPTIVGGSKKHGGPDLGPTRAKQAWLKLGVNGNTIANEAPAKDHEGLPRLTTRMVARIQGFPDTWKFQGVKTHAYRQVGNAFPPPVAAAVGEAIAEHLKKIADAKSSPEEIAA